MILLHLLNYNSLFGEKQICITLEESLDLNCIYTGLSKTFLRVNTNGFCIKLKHNPQEKRFQFF